MGRACSTYGEMSSAHNVVVGKPEGRRPLERPMDRWRIILKWIFDQFGGRGHGLDGSGLVQGQVASSLECGNGLSSSIKWGEFLELLRTCQLLRKASFPQLRIRVGSEVVTALTVKSRQRSVGLSPSCQWPGGNQAASLTESTAPYSRSNFYVILQTYPCTMKRTFSFHICVSYY